jgi:glutaredoxin-like protein
MAFIEEKDKKPIRDKLAEMAASVKIIYFTQELECQFCRETHQIMKELTDLSEKLSLEVFNFQIDKAKAEEYKIDKIPATAIKGEKDYGIRFYGIPAGYEFMTLLESITAVSRADSGLAPSTREKLKTVTQPIHIQVFVTPT